MLPFPTVFDQTSPPPGPSHGYSFALPSIYLISSACHTFNYRFIYYLFIDSPIGLKASWKFFIVYLALVTLANRVDFQKYFFSKWVNGMNIFMKLYHLAGSISSSLSSSIYLWRRTEVLSCVALETPHSSFSWLWYKLLTGPGLAQQ